MLTRYLGKYLSEVREQAMGRHRERAFKNSRFKGPEAEEAQHV